MLERSNTSGQVIKNSNLNKYLKQIFPPSITREMWS